MRLNKALLTTAVVLSLAVAGCSGGSSDGGAAEDGPVTLSYGVWDQNQVPALKQMIADFEKTNKNIKVKVQVTPYDQYFTKLQAAATGGAAPDVFWMNGPNFQLYASNGVLAPISDQIKKDGLDTSVYPKSLVDLYSLDGKEYGLPKDFDTIGLWYNKTLFDDAGVKYPDATWTWTDSAECRGQADEQEPRASTASRRRWRVSRTSTTRSCRPAGTSCRRTARARATTTRRPSRACRSGRI